MAASKAERFAAFLVRLDAAPPADSHEGALRLVGQTLDGVEDEMSGVSFDPSRHDSDGRMYPPQADAARPVEDRPTLVRYRSRGHNTYIAANGAILILTAGPDNAERCLDKPGRDGRLVEL